MANIDTHAIIKDFITSGISEPQAEMIVAKVIAIAKNEIDSVEKQRPNLVTNTDLFQVRSELKTEIVEIKRDIKWGMALLGVICGLLIKIAFFNSQ